MANIEAMSPGRQLLHGARWNALTVLVGLGGQLLLLSLLARLLSTQQLALSATILVVVNFAETFTDLGLSAATVQANLMSPAQSHTLRRVNVLTGLLISAGFFAAASWLASLLGLPHDSSAALQSFAPYFFLASLSQQNKAVAERALNFKLVSQAETLYGFVLPLFSLVIVAYTKCGSAVVYGALAAVFARSAYLRLRAPLDRSSPAPLQAIRPLLKFGAVQSSDGVLNYAASTGLALIIGNLLHADALADWVLVWNLTVAMPGRLNPILTRVMFPVMSRRQEQSFQIASLYLKVISVTSLVNGLYLVTLWLNAPLILGTIYGSQYEDLGVLLGLLAVFGLLRAINNPIGPVLMALGRVGLGLQVNIIKSALTIAAVITGIHLDGSKGAALSLILVGMLSLIVNGFITQSLLRMRVSNYVVLVFVVIILGAVATLVGYGSGLFLHLWLNSWLSQLTATLALLSSLIFLLAWQRANCRTFLDRVHYVGPRHIIEREDSDG